LLDEGLVVGLDIGTTKICAIIGEQNKDGKLEITGVGVSPSTGLRKGVVVNIEATLQSVSAAIEHAELMSGCDVKSCWVGIGGSHIDGINSRGVVAVSGRNRETREITQEDVDRVLEAAKAVVIPMDRQVLQVIPQNYIVDDHKGVRYPLNMIAVRLESEVHIITCGITGAKNLTNCVNRAGFKVDGLVLQSLAAGTSVLTEEEKELGVALVDLGGGTTDVMVYSQGTPFSTMTIPVGGVQVTNDLSLVNNVSFETAEKIKLDAGCCWESFLDGNEEIIVSSIGGRVPQSIQKSQIMNIIKPRMEEIFLMVKEKIDHLSLSRPLGAGIVLTGGGSRLPGAAELASYMFRLPVRIGVPLSIGGLVEEYRNPEYATAVGLMLEGAMRESIKDSERGREKRTREKKQKLSIKKIWDWLKKELF
jgi:cell division protein FtsA